jgi:hypothetical protein
MQTDEPEPGRCSKKAQGPLHKKGDQGGRNSPEQCEAIYGGDKKRRVAEVADMAIAITAIIGSDMSSEAKTQVRTNSLAFLYWYHTAYRCADCRLSMRWSTHKSEKNLSRRLIRARQRMMTTRRVTPRTRKWPKEKLPSTV